jgi:hypothetical protein
MASEIRGLRVSKNQGLGFLGINVSGFLESKESSFSDLKILGF